MSKDNEQVTPEVKEVKPETTEAKEEKTIGEVLQAEPKKEPTKPEFTPADFMAVKSKNKELAKTVKELQEKIAKGADNDEVDDDVEDIYEQFPDVDKKFIKLVTKQAKEAAKAEFDDKFRPIEEERKSAEINKIFNKYYKDAMEKMPEYADIVDKEVIKTLSLQKSNANKTFPQIIEETYGRAIVGRKTIETTTPRGGKESGAIDYARAAKDTEYFKEIMSDPTSKKNYNDGLAQRIIR